MSVPFTRNCCRLALAVGKELTGGKRPPHGWQRLAAYSGGPKSGDMKGYLNTQYSEAKKSINEITSSISSNMLNPDAIFSNNEMSLNDIGIYGFDYDYTLAFYSKDLHTLIFNTARDLLINEHRVRLFSHFFF
ncbi:5'-nucleotidase domain-containing protein 3-like, partial [Bombina bombina]|uniref:5'-nucleotidase domain-containing protein 3-like n=1 Tax=Bombina bombina TaxID=8345 RepID=UPI00235A55C0